MYRIALIEDDRNICRTLTIAGAARNFDLQVFVSAEDFQQRADFSEFAALIVDLHLPGSSGMQLCYAIRQAKCDVPIVMLTAQTDQQTAVQGFQAGVDDFVRKPCGNEELFARLTRLLLRKSSTPEVLKFRAIELHLNNRSVRCHDQEIKLTPTEYGILKVLLEHSGSVVQRSHLLATIDPVGTMGERAIDAHVSNLRKKICSVATDDVHIAAVYGEGYCLEERR
jgi:DNA-binding response OmpR family regulator